MTTDAQRAVLDPLLPDPAWLAGRGGRPEARCRRQIVDAIFYLVDNGIKWGSANRLSALAQGLQTPGRLGSRRPEGFATWDDWRRDIGLPDSELGIGADSIIDPRGAGPRIWFHVMPDAEVVKNRVHLDIHVSGSRSDPLAARMQRVDAEAKRLTDLGAMLTGALNDDGLDHDAVGMKDPEGNEFDIN